MAAGLPFNLGLRILRTYPQNRECSSELDALYVGSDPEEFHISNFPFKNDSYNQGHDISSQ